MTTKAKKKSTKAPVTAEATASPSSLSEQEIVADTKEGTVHIGARDRNTSSVPG
jgi:hypothetical protein